MTALVEAVLDHNFSNHAFYNGILQVSPNVQFKAPKPPIEWVDCPEGMWENRSNTEKKVNMETSVASQSQIIAIVLCILSCHLLCITN